MRRQEGHQSLVIVTGAKRPPGLGENAGLVGVEEKAPLPLWVWSRRNGSRFGVWKPNAVCSPARPLGPVPSSTCHSPSWKSVFLCAPSPHLPLLGPPFSLLLSILFILSVCLACVSVVSWLCGGVCVLSVSPFRWRFPGSRSHFLGPGKLTEA